MQRIMGDKGDRERASEMIPCDLLFISNTWFFWLEMVLTVTPKYADEIY